MRRGLAGCLFATLLLTSAVSAAGPPDETSALASLQRAVIEAIDRAAPSVVAIARVRESTEAGRIIPRPDPFGREAHVPEEPAPTDPDFVPNAYATGVVVDRGGLILTAHHVLAEQSTYYVTTNDRKVYRAVVRAADPRSDLAVLSIQAGSMKPISFGDGSQLKRGQFVIALGNPHAIARDGQPSASWGIISNLSRKAPPRPSADDPTGRGTLHHFGTLIQTDARLNLGTSGGPLLDLEGRMVGLCVSLAAVKGHDTDAGYAIPVDRLFHRALDQLKQGREVQYGFLGIRPTNLRPDEVRAGLHGTRVAEVVPGTPAQRDGLRPGDLIRAVDGRPIHSADGLYLQVGKLPVESTTRLDVLRDRRPRRVDVRLTKYPVRGRTVATSREPAWRGLRVDYLSAWIDASGGPLRRGVAFDEGVAVSHVEPGSPAALGGLRPGTIITAVAGQPVATPKQFRRAVAGHAGPVELSTLDAVREGTLTVPPP